MIMATLELSSGEGIHFLSDFWTKHYLEEYIKEGGSKIKFVTGRPGSGKSFFLRIMKEEAEKRNYLTASFSATEVWLHDFKEIYLEILEQCDILQCLHKCAEKIVLSMGYEPSEIEEGQTFLDMLSSRGAGDAITKREIRMQLRSMFLQNPLLDNNFAIACSLLTGSILGHPILEQQNQELLLGWLSGDKTVKLSLLRALGLSPSRITKFNARHMLRSLAEVIRLGGHSGLLVLIDDLEILQSKSGMDGIHYTKLRREDTYESIRQLIDDIDSLRGIFFIFAFDRILIDNDNAGLASYQALWMRIQNEIVGERFNRFTDIADMDALAYQVYTPEYLVSMAEQFARKEQEMLQNRSSLSLEAARELLTRSRFAGSGIPRLICESVTESAASSTNTSYGSETGSVFLDSSEEERPGTPQVINSEEETGHSKGGNADV